MKMKAIKVVVGIPSGSTWNASFGVSLVDMVSYFASTKVPGYDAQSLQVVNTRSSILPRNRLDIIKKAQELNATHLLFIDTDHTFPKWLIHRLVTLEKQVVAINCVTKTIPAGPTGRKKSDDPRGELVYTDPDNNHVEEVWRIGTGVMLIEMGVFKKVGNACWGMTYMPDVDSYMGEDWNFCVECEEAGIPLFVDHMASQYVGHEGMLIYTHDFVGTVQPEKGESHG
jgi:hypothetical protein